LIGLQSWSNFALAVPNPLKSLSTGGPFSQKPRGKCSAFLGFQMRKDTKWRNRRILTWRPGTPELEVGCPSPSPYIDCAPQVVILCKRQAHQRRIRTVSRFASRLRVGIFGWGAVPGLRPPRRTPSGAIFAASLREEVQDLTGCGDEQAAEKGGISGENGEKKRPSGTEAHVGSVGFARGLKPPPPSESSFCAACDAVLSARLVHAIALGTVCAGLWGRMGSDRVRGRYAERSCSRTAGARYGVA
jgi:hypothetical protein